MPTITYEPVESTVEEVPTAFGERIARKLKALTKRLAKMGVPAPTVEFGPVVHIEYPVEGNELTSGPKATYPAWETVTVKGFEAKADGWTGVAVLDWTVSPDEAFVARFPGHTDEDTAPAISDELRTRGPVCDHCGTKRTRNNTIVFLHDDGRTIAVGTGCVLEYLGVDPRTILMLSEFVASVSDDDDFGTTVRPSLDPVEFVALAAELTRYFGFARSADTNSTRELTTSIGIIGLTASKADRALAAELANEIDMDRGRVKAAAIAAWLAEGTGTDFLRSASVALGGNPVEVGSRHAGILAALPFSHDRHIGLVAERDAKRKADAEARVLGGFVGEVDGKIEVTGEVVFYNVYEGTYGSKARVTILTADGDRVTTYGSGNTVFGWATGDKVKMVGKVRSHDDSVDYGKTTTLERVKMVELDADGAPLPVCSAARCTRPAAESPCDGCGKLVCANGHGRGYRDEFYCDTCINRVWEDERRRELLAKATVKAARVLLGAPPAGSPFSSFRLSAAQLEMLVPA